MRRFWQICAYLYAVLFPFILFVTLEVLNTNARAFAPPTILGDWPIVLLSGIALALVMGMLFAVTGNLFVSGLLTALAAGACYVVSYYRLVLSGWVFVPAELAMVAHAKELASFTKIEFYPIVRVFAALIVMEVAALFAASLAVKQPIRRRMVALPFLMLVTLGLFGTGHSARIVLPKFHIDMTEQRPANMTYRENGVLLGFYQGVFNAQTSGAPIAYTDEDLDDWTAALKTRADARQRRETGVRPNVVIVMSEAFFDPTVMGNVTFSTDPEPNLHRLQQAYTHGDNLSPAFGGSTCNVEWELLTGNALTFAGSGYNFMPYERESVFIPDDDGRALPHVFQNNGYKTVSVHSYEEGMFNRNTIYPKLGFQKSVFMEDMPDAPIKGKFISDAYFTDRILEEIDAANAEDTPLFLFAISMQNHYEYYPTKYKQYDVTCQSDLLDEFQTNSLNAYAQGAYDADKQLGRLIDEIEKSGRPTIVLFFGDHLPLVYTEAYDMYHTLGYVTSTNMGAWTLEDRYKIFTTPYVVWNNFTDKDDGWGAASPYFMGALVAEKAGVRLNYYEEFLLETFRGQNGFRGMKDGVFINADRTPLPAPDAAAERAVAVFKAYQHDKIFGFQHADATLRAMVP